MSPTESMWWIWNWKLHQVDCDKNVFEHNAMVAVTNQAIGTRVHCEESIVVNLKLRRSQGCVTTNARNPSSTQKNLSCNESDLYLKMYSNVTLCWKLINDNLTICDLSRGVLVLLVVFHGLERLSMCKIHANYKIRKFWSGSVNWRGVYGQHDQTCSLDIDYILSANFCYIC